MRTHAVIVQSIIDHAYARFVADLPQELQATAEALPHRLGLTPHPSVPWSAVFNNPAVLAMPMLLAGGERLRMPPAVRAAATEAHLFAIISAFGLDRVEDGQVAADAQICAVLERLRRARDLTFLRVLARTGGHTPDFTWAEEVTRASQTSERRVLDEGEAGTMAAYLEVALQKQGLAFPATLAAAAAGWSTEDCAHTEALLAGAALGLQYRDDVVDWIDDQRRGGSWAVALLPDGADRGSIDELAARLDRAGVLVDLLRRSAEAFTQAERAAAALGVPELAEWSHEQAALTAGLADLETREPGAAVAWELVRLERRAARQRSLIAS
jgi:hypothetical protein